MSESIAYRLSSLDQSGVRSYIRCCYSFSREAADPEIDDVIAALESSTRRAMEHFPILAGSVVAESEASSTGTLSARQNSYRRGTVGVRQAHSLSTQARRESTGSNTFALLRIHDDGDDDKTETEQRGYLKVLVTPSSQNSKPRVKTFNSAEFPSTYGELVAQGFPSSALTKQHTFTPLPDIPGLAQASSPVFVVQANFIEGGVIVVIFLHHAVADVFDLAKIVQCMSIGKELTTPGALSVHSNAVEDGRSRDRLSGSRGVKATIRKPIEQERKSNRELSYPNDSGLAHGGSTQVLAFDLDKIESTTEMMNERSALTLEEPQPRITPFECLVSILWKSFARARRHRVRMEQNHMSVLRVPVNMRRRVDPPLGDGYFGNACLFAKATAPVLRLGLPFEIGTLNSTAYAVHNSLAATSETELRATIAAINESSDVRRAIDAQADINTDVLIADWSELPMATLGLGLGPADFVREVSRESCTHGFLVLPKKEKARLWEVAAQFDERTLAQLADDVGLRPFVLRVA